MRHVERGVALHRDSPAGLLQIPGRIQVGGAVPGRTEPQELATVPHPGHVRPLRRHGARGQGAGGDGDVVGEPSRPRRAPPRNPAAARAPRRRSSRDGPKLSRKWETRCSATSPGACPKPITSNSSAGRVALRQVGELVDRQPVEPSLDRRQHERDGLGDEPGAAARCCGSRCRPRRMPPRRAGGPRVAGSPGRWNSPRVVTTFVPTRAAGRPSSKSQPCGMYSTQSAPRARMSSTSFVARTPVASSAAEFAGVAPDLVGGCARTHRPGQVRVLDHGPQRHGSRCCRWPTGRPGSERRIRPRCLCRCRICGLNGIRALRVVWPTGSALRRDRRRARERKPSSLSSEVRTRVFRDMIDTSCPATSDAERADGALLLRARGRTGRTSTSASRSRGSSCRSRRRGRRGRDTASSSSGARRPRRVGVRVVGLPAHVVDADVVAQLHADRVADEAREEVLAEHLARQPAAEVLTASTRGACRRCGRGDRGSTGSTRCRPRTART